MSAHDRSSLEYSFSQKLNAASYYGISGSVLVFVPAVGRANLYLGESFLYIIDAVQQFRTCKIASIQCLGADSNSIDYVCVLRDVFLESFLVGFECSGSIGPTDSILASLPLQAKRRVEMRGPYHTPSTTLILASAAAGRIS